MADLRWEKELTWLQCCHRHHSFAFDFTSQTTTTTSTKHKEKPINTSCKYHNNQNFQQFLGTDCTLTSILHCCFQRLTMKKTMQKKQKFLPSLTQCCQHCQNTTDSHERHFPIAKRPRSCRERGVITKKGTKINQSRWNNAGVSKHYWLSAAGNVDHIGNSTLDWQCDWYFHTHKSNSSKQRLCCESLQQRANKDKESQTKTPVFILASTSVGRGIAPLINNGEFRCGRRITTAGEAA